MSLSHLPNINEFSTGVLNLWGGRDLLLSGFKEVDSHLIANKNLQPKSTQTVKVCLESWSMVANPINSSHCHPTVFRFSSETQNSWTGVYFPLGLKSNAWSEPLLLGVSGVQRGFYRCSRWDLPEMPSRYHHLHFQWAIFTDLNTQRLNLSVFLGDTIKLHNEASLCYSGYVANVFKDTCIKLQVLVPLDHHPLNIRKLLAQPMRMSWMNPWAFCPLLISAVGILLTTEVQSIFLPCYPLPHILIPSPSSPLAPPHPHVCQLQCPVLQREDVKNIARIANAVQCHN